MSTKKWNIRIKMSTDRANCKAESPEGEVNTISLRTGGSLTASIAGEPEEGCLQLDADPGIEKDILAGYHLFVKNQPGRKASIIRYDPGTSLLYYQGPRIQTAGQQTIEISSGEPLFIQAVRLLTRRRRDEVLPSVRMEVSPEGPYQPSLSPLILLISGESAQLTETVSASIIRVREKIDRSGRIAVSLDESELNKVLREVYKHPGARILIRLSNSHVNPVHEQSLANLLHTAGYTKIFPSHQADLLIGSLPQFDRTFAETYLVPQIREYLNWLVPSLGEGSAVTLSL